MHTKIEQTRRLQLPWDTRVIVNDHDRPRSYQMTPSAAGVPLEGDRQADRGGARHVGSLHRR